MADDDKNQPPMFEDESDQARTWIQENLRIIVSVFIVAAIALGIYSYSQRAEVAENGDGSFLDELGQDEDEVADEPGLDDDGLLDDAQDVVTPGRNQDSDSVALSEGTRETETSFVVQAERGEGTTHLARHALAHYLEKNPDSALSAEHKVYIEDYLRKNVGFQGGVTPSTSIEFSKDLIAQAIDHSKQLNDRQLENLKKYSARVSAFN